MGTKRFGKYQLLRELASGGMGEVFLARQAGLAGFQKPVVLKRILAHLAREPAFVEMFLNEARLAALLQHANVVQIFELGQEQDTYFIAMELVHGRTLRQIGERLSKLGRPFPPGQLARIASQALLGLHYAHQLRDDAGEALHIIHRDVTPENVMVGFDGSVKMLDFGIAKASSLVGDTRAGVLKGKVAYLAPEMLVGGGYDARVDLWAMGVTLYELLAGQRPFDSTHAPALVKQIVTERPVPLSARATQLPPELGAIVERAMSKAPEQRFGSAEEMGAALEHLAATQGVALSNTETRAFMRELYGAEADENPVAVTPSRPEVNATPTLADRPLRSGRWARWARLARRALRHGWKSATAGALLLLGGW
ncbi:MAG: serine/threonine protein kinase [Archangiaceae bacterium]|nr:serine/threonine protein kinase [Archangiaceae bacterium]